MSPFRKNVSSLTIGCCLAVLLADPATAQVGPPAPVEKPQKPTAKEVIKEKFNQLFKPQEEAEEVEYEEVRKGAGIPGQFDTVRQKVQKKPEGPQQGASPDAPQPRLLQKPPMLSQPQLENPTVTNPEVSSENPPQKLPTLDNPANPSGLADAQGKLNEIAALIEKKQTLEAKNRLNPLKDWLIDSTEAHINLYKALSNVPSARVQAELEKQVALEFAQMRDKAFFQMGKIHIAEHDPKKAIKMLVEVIKSQPRGEMGLKAYELLQQIGFTQKLQLVE